MGVLNVFAIAGVMAALTIITNQAKPRDTWFQLTSWTGLAKTTETYQSVNASQGGCLRLCIARAHCCAFSFNLLKENTCYLFDSCRFDNRYELNFDPLYIKQGMDTTSTKKSISPTIAQTTSTEETVSLTEEGWTNWSTCATTCGGSIVVRTRNVVPVDAKDGKTVEEKVCAETVCPQRPKCSDRFVVTVNNKGEEFCERIRDISFNIYP